MHARDDEKAARPPRRPGRARLTILGGCCRALTLIIARRRRRLRNGDGAARSRRVGADRRVTLIGDSIATAIEYEPDARDDPREGDRSRPPARRLPPHRRRRAARTRASGRRRSSTSSPRSDSDRRSSSRCGYNDFEDTFATTGRDGARGAPRRGRRARPLADAAGRAPVVPPHERDRPRRREAPSGAHGRRLEPLLAKSPGLVPARRPAPRPGRRDRDGDARPPTLDDLGLVATPTPRALAIATTRLPAGHVGRRYASPADSRPVASAPIRWARAKGTLPAGLALRPERDRSSGTPRVAGRQFARAARHRYRAVAPWRGASRSPSRA